MPVEQATLDDVDAMVDAWIDLAEEQRQYESHLEPDANRELMRQLFAAHVVDDSAFVVREDGQLIGFATTEIEQDGLERSVKRGFIQNIYVDPAKRNRGIGSELLNAAETRLREQGVEVVTLEVLADNDAAQRLYRDRGYRPHRIEYEKSDTHSREH